MIRIEDIKIGSVLQIREVDLEDITWHGFIEKIDPNNIYDSLTIKVVDMVNGRCEIALSAHITTSVDVDVAELANVAVYSVANEQFIKKIVETYKSVNNLSEGTANKLNGVCDMSQEQVSHPSHYAWLKDLCGVEPLDICRHLDFNVGNAIKYLLRKDKVDGNKTKTEKRIEDLRKAVFYIQDEIKLLEHGTD